MITALFIGLITGSFFNMLIYRLTNKVSLFNPKYSVCTSCNHRLGFFDLIPLGSYLLLKGRCRYCSEKIGVGYLLLEIFAGLLSVLFFFYFGMTLIYFLSFLIYMFLLAIVISDLKTREVEYFLSFGLLGLVVLRGGWEWVSLGIASAVFLLFLAVSLLGKLFYKKEVFGGADVLLLGIGSYAFRGSALGLFLYFPFVIGSLFGVGLMLIKKQKYMAFAPCIVLSFILTDLFGDSIMDWYLTLF